MMFVIEQWNEEAESDLKEIAKSMTQLKKLVKEDKGLLVGVFEKDVRIGTLLYRIDDFSEYSELICMHAKGRVANFLKKIENFTENLATMEKCRSIRVHIKNNSKAFFRFMKMQGYVETERVFTKDLKNGF